MFKFLFIFFAILYLGSLLVKWAFRKWVSNITNQQSNGPDKKHKKEGEVTIEYGSTGKQKKNSGEGEYIDYEELK